MFTDEVLRVQKNEPLLSGMHVFMLFEAVVCVHRRGVGSAKKMNLSQVECKFLCYLRLWYVFPHEVLGVQKNEPLPSGMQFFVLFEVVVCVPTRGVAM